MMRTMIRAFCCALGMLWAATAYSQDTIRVGILHSLSGTMAVSERTLKDSLLMLIEKQNQRGGLLGRTLEPVVLDPASSWPLYAEKARQLIEREGVAVIFGCWTSASRKAVKPVVEELGGLLFYPVQYEGQEFSPNIFYLGATPNQQALPAVNYLLQEEGIERWILAGTDYIYPRTANRIILAHLQSQGISSEDILLSYTPFGHGDWQRIVAEFLRFASEGKRTAVVSTINGDANIHFYRELAAQRITSHELPVLAFSISEEELSLMEPEPLRGHMAAWNYFMSLENSRNEAFISSWRDFMDDKSRLTNDPMEAHFIGFHMWLAAVEKAGTVETNAVREAMIGVSAPNLSGGMSRMEPNHHIKKPVYIGKVEANGQYHILWQSQQYIPADPWSEYLLPGINRTAQ